MFWLFIILGTLCLFICWLLVSPVELEIDTEKGNAELRWIGLGKIRIWHEEEWWLSIRLFFFSKTIPFSKIKKRPKKETASPAIKKQKSRSKTISYKKIVQIFSTLKPTKWQLAIDLGEFDRNARLYPLNFLPGTYGHLHINFLGKNYLAATIKGRPWKIVYAFLK